MTADSLRLLLLSDFNVDNLAALLENDDLAPQLQSVLGPFGQVSALLIDARHPVWQDGVDYLLLWTRPEGVAAAYQTLISGDAAPIETILDEVETYCAHVKKAADQVKAVFVPTWTRPPYVRGLGMLDQHPGNPETGEGMGTGYALNRMNLHLVEGLRDTSNVFVLDAARWLAVGESKGWNPKGWYMGKMAFGNSVCREAVRDVKAGIRGLLGQARKLIVLDLDDTLWGGIVGDQGWQNLTLGGHDPVGEAFVHFQHRLKALTRRGVILGVVSKNEEDVALEAIDRHPEMILRRDDFAAWRINWHDKAMNIAALAEEVNLGLQSIVFIDDNPAERARVRDMLPEVAVPEWPKNPLNYVMALESLPVFDQPSFSQEDRQRTVSYVAERKRAQLKTDLTSPDEWLRAMQVKVTVEELHEAHLQRCVQLLNKTNQMNLTTRRVTENELLEWLHQDQTDRKLWTVRVADHFGDSGLTGIVSVDVDGAQARLVDFVLSCRVFGRKVEETMLAVASAYAARRGAAVLIADYFETPKNRPCRRFLEGSALTCSGNRFTLDLQQDYPFPDDIEVCQ